MKKKYTILGSCLFLLSLVACQKESIMLYEQASGIYFNGSSTTYSFIENVKNLEWGSDTINLPVLITGAAVDYDRDIKVEAAVDDTLMTAESHMYKILGGYIPANEYSGLIKVQINYSEELDDSIYVACFRIRPCEHFPVTDLNEFTYMLSFTNKFTIPSNWNNRLKRFFGDYSDSWYTYILQVTGLSSLPYWSNQGSNDPNNPDPERWTMTYDEVKAYAAMVKVALTKYNNAHPGNPMLHGEPIAGKPVSMP